MESSFGKSEKSFSSTNTTRSKRPDYERSEKHVQMQVALARRPSQLHWTSVSPLVTDSPSFLNYADSYSEKGDADSDIDERDTGGETYVYGLRACAFYDEIFSLAPWSRRPD